MSDNEVSEQITTMLEKNSLSSSDIQNSDNISENRPSELTQTDHLNKQLLESLLSRLNGGEMKTTYSFVNSSCNQDSEADAQFELT